MRQAFGTPECPSSSNIATKAKQSLNGLQSISSNGNVASEGSTSINIDTGMRAMWRSSSVISVRQGEKEKEMSRKLVKL